MFLRKQNLGTRPRIRPQLPSALAKSSRTSSRQEALSSQNSSNHEIQAQVYPPSLLKKSKRSSSPKEQERDLSQSKEKKLLTYLLKVVKQQCKDEYRKQKGPRNDRIGQKTEQKVPLHVLGSLSIGSINISKKKMSSCTSPSPSLCKTLFEKNKQTVYLQRRHSYLHYPAQLMEKMQSNQVQDFLDQSQGSYLQTREKPRKLHFSRRDRAKTTQEDNSSKKSLTLVKTRNDHLGVKAKSSRIMEVSKLDMLQLSKLEVKVDNAKTDNGFRSCLNKTRKGKKPNLLSVNMSEGQICLNTHQRW